MPSFNKIIIVGYLGQDPELRYTPQGTAMCKFSIATTEKRKDNDGNAEERTTWFRCTAWGRQAEVAQEYLSKGSQTYVEGQLREEKYTDRDGQTRSSLEVNVREIQFIGARGEQSERSNERSAHSGEQRETASRSTSNEKQTDGSGKTPLPLDEDDIPF